MASYNNKNRPGSSPDRYQHYTPAHGVDLREAAGLPTILLVLAWLFFWPLGLTLTVIRHIGRSQQKEAAQWMQAYAAAGLDQPPAAARSGSAGKTGSKTSKRSSNPRKKGTFLVNFLFGLGIFVALVGFINISDPLYFLFVHGFDRYDLWEAFGCLGWIASGSAMMIASRFFKRRNRLWNKLEAIVGKKDHMYVSEISKALSSSEKDTVNALEKAIDHGRFGNGAYLDMHSKCLVVRGPAPQPQQPANPVPPKEENQYQALLRQLREVNDAIPGEEMSAKINRLENVSAKIFEMAEKSPEKLPQMRRFMDYYLPTALKLLRSYAEFDSQGVDGAYISDSKAKIESTLDSLVVGFEQQLDKLFREDALDVSTDISVLQNMMAQDGLDGQNSPFGL